MTALLDQPMSLFTVNTDRLIKINLKEIRNLKICM